MTKRDNYSLKDDWKFLLRNVTIFGNLTVEGWDELFMKMYLTITISFLKPIICRLKFFMWAFSFLKATTHPIKILSYKSTPYIQIPIYWAGTQKLYRRVRQMYKKNIKCTKDKCTLRSSLESDRFMIFVLLCPVATQLAQSILRRLVVEYEDCLLLALF